MTAVWQTILLKAGSIIVGRQDNMARELDPSPGETIPLAGFVREKKIPYRLVVGWAGLAPPEKL